MSMPEIRAAGGVVWRSPSGGSRPNGTEVALVHRPKYDDWTIPKGKLKSGETDFEAALREVLEETGYRVRPGRDLGEVRYLKNSRGETRQKVVRYWAMEADRGAFAPSQEIDGLRWVPINEARDLLTYPTDREVLGRFSSQPTPTGLVLLTRHASAGNRAKWKGDDRRRPLDEKGHAQAENLVKVLAPFDISKIVSAHFVRCTQTVEPLAKVLGLPVEEEPLLSESGYPGHEDEAVDLIRRWAEQGATVVASSQGDVIPDLLSRLATEDRAHLAHEFIAKKGSVWVMSFAGTELCNAEYFPPHPNRN
jgi:8-oxo-(d)GTP phosphatase